MGYKWKLDFGGFVLEVRKPDHEEKHCHAVRHPGCHLKISLETLAVLAKPKGFNGREIAAIVDAVKRHRDLLLAKWSDQNG